MNAWTLPDLAQHLKPLRAVLAVADTGSTGAAAQVLHLSQPAVARAVLQLEAALAQKLFDRVPQGMRPAAAGDILAARMRRALAHLANTGLKAPAGRLAAMATPRQLQVLSALGTHPSEGMAAQALGISQPAVHQALRQLEYLAGGPLFERSAQGVRANTRGRAVLQQVKLALAELRSAAEDLASLRGELQGRIVVGTLPYSAGLFVPRALERLVSRHPGVRVTIVDGTYESLMAQLRQADIDLLVGALRNPPPAGAVRQVKLFDDPLAVVVRSGHPLLGQPLQSLAQVRDAGWILPMPGVPARVALDQAFAADGLPPPDRGVQVNSPTIMQALLLESDRLALMSPRQLEREIAAGLLAVLPVRVRHVPRPVGLTLRADFAPAPAMQLFLDALHRGDAA